MKDCARVTRVLRSNLLLLLTLVGVVLGLSIGFAVRTGEPSMDVLMWLGLPGQLYLRLLKMMIVPLIVASVITGTASLDPKANGKISLISFVFIFVTNCFGATLGVAAFYIFSPGTNPGGATEKTNLASQPTQTGDIFADLLRNILPDNLFEATFRQTQTSYEYSSNTTMNNSVSLTLVEKSIGKTDGPNLLGLIFACTLIGIAASSIKKKGRVLIEFFEAATQTVIVILQWFLWTTPLGVLSLIAVAIAEISDVTSIFRDLGVFIAAVTVALVIQQLVLMPGILFLLTRRNPYRHMGHISRPWIIAFAAASTAVAMPEMLHACETFLRVDKRIARFVVPFSVTISANGSAVFIATSCLFIANFTGSALSMGTAFMIWLLATVASLAIPSVPSSSIVTIVMILTSLNIPVDAIALLLAVEFFLDRLRTTSSVVSHTMCAVVTYHMCKDDLNVEDRTEREEDQVLELKVEDTNL